MTSRVGRTGPTLTTDAAAAQPRVELFDLSSGNEVQLKVSGKDRTKDPIALETYRNAQRVDRALRDHFQRDGWDGKGSPLKVVVHTPDENGNKLNNAYWDGSKIYFGDGDGQILAPLGKSMDVTFHEATHAVVDSEVNLRYEGQQGAINESFADVLACVADKADWKIGEDVFTPGVNGDSIRDLRQPHYSHTRQLKGAKDVEVHDLSGIPSLAAVKVGETVGREKMGKIWYHALTEKLDSRAGFAGAARATLDAARDLYGTESKEFSAVNDAWKAVGVASRWKP